MRRTRAVERSIQAVSAAFIGFLRWRERVGDVGSWGLRSVRPAGRALARSKGRARPRSGDEVCGK